MFSSTRKLVLTALFVAITFLLGMTPIGLIPLGFINVTTLCIPVIVGTILLGLKGGLLLGVCFGACSALSAFGMSPLMPPSGLASALVARSPALALVMCFVPRLAVPVVTHLTCRAFAKKKWGLPVSAVVGSLTNTVLYLGMMLLFYIATGLDARSILALIAGTGLIAGGSEAAVAAILTTPIVLALRRLDEKTRH